MHESWIFFCKLAQPVFWKLSEVFRGITLGHFCIRKPEMLLKKNSTTGVSYFRKYLKVDDF